MSGDAQVSEKHANFMVNLGHARAADVLALMGKCARGERPRASLELGIEGGRSGLRPIDEECM